MTIGNRIRMLRRSLNLTQQEFADRIGIKRNTVGTYEIGRNTPIDAVISLICREFRVSETWLRTGEGEMLEPETPLDLGEYARRRGATRLEEDIIRAWFDLPEQERHRLLDHFRRYLTGGTDSPVSSPPETPEQRLKRHKQEAAVEAMEYYQEVLEEKSQVGERSVSGVSSVGIRTKMA